MRLMRLLLVVSILAGAGAAKAAAAGGDAPNKERDAAAPNMQGKALLDRKLVWAHYTAWHHIT